MATIIIVDFNIVLCNLPYLQHNMTPNDSYTLYAHVHHVNLSQFLLFLLLSFIYVSRFADKYICNVRTHTNICINV